MATDLSLAFQFENGLAFTETDIAIFSGSVDPSAGAGTPAPRGSLFLRDNGELYIKAGEADTSWNWHLQADDVVINVVQPSSGLTITGGPIQNSGTLTFALSNDLSALEGLVGTGFATRTGADTWATRTILGTAGNITVNDGDGIAGSPIINLATVGTAGTFGSATSVPVFTADAFGRVTAVTNTAISLSLDNLSDVTITSPTSGQVLSYNGTSWVNSTPTSGGSGTVTSVAATAPTSGFTIIGSPITTSGTLVFALSNDLAAVEGIASVGFAVRTGADTWDTAGIYGTLNRITVTNNLGADDVGIDIASTYAGQTSITTLGTIGTGTWQGATVETAYGGTGLSTIGTANQVLGVNVSGTALEYKSIVAGSGISISSTAGQIQITSTAPGGTVTSVAATQPAAGLTITGSPITTSGTLVFSLSNDLAAVEGLSTTGIAVRTSADTWETRSLTSGQNITVTNANGVAGNPSIALSGVVPIANGGTGLSALGTALQVLRVNDAGTALEYATVGGTGTVTSVAATQPAAGLTITGSPITTTGTLVFSLANDLGAIEALNGTGFYTRTGTDTWAARSLTQPASGLTITNPAGVAGNPTFALANDLAAVEGLTTTGIAVRTSADTWATRTIQGTTNQITVTDGAGTAGDPTIAIATNPIIPGTGSVQIPSGTTVERTSPAANGMIRYNTTTNQYEAWVVDKWVGLALFSDGGTYQIDAYLGPIPSTSGTSAVPFDSTEPLATEGTEIWSRTVTPTSSTSRFVVECPFTVDIGTSNRVLIVSIFRGTVNLGSALFYSTGGGRPITLSMKVNDTPGTTSPITFSMRAGIGAGTGTWYINATAGGQTLGGKLVSQYEIREFSQ